MLLKVWLNHLFDLRIGLQGSMAQDLVDCARRIHLGKRLPGIPQGGSAGAVSEEHTDRTDEYEVYEDHASQSNDPPSPNRNEEIDEGDLGDV